MAPYEKPIYVPNCILCSYSTKPDTSEEQQIYNFILSLVKDGVAYNKAAKDVLDFIDARGFIAKSPKSKSVWNHFDKHEQSIIKTQIEVAREQKGLKNKQPIVDYALIEQITKDNFDEYDELCKLYVKFKEVSNNIYELNESLQIEGAASGSEDWSQNKIQTFNSMINTQKSILSEISKMRQGEKLVALAARFIIEEFTRSMVFKLKTEFETFADVMTRQNVSDSVVEAFLEMASHKVTQIFIDESVVAMDSTRKEFKLPN